MWWVRRTHAHTPVHNLTIGPADQGSPALVSAAAIAVTVVRVCGRPPRLTSLQVRNGLGLGKGSGLGFRARVRVRAKARARARSACCAPRNDEIAVAAAARLLVLNIGDLGEG
eukprot:scaffold133092_cov51-Phaeocystis_antarctica.AAC.1